MPAGFGPQPGVRDLIEERPGCDTTRTTSGAFCASWAGPASAQAGGHWSATRRRSGTGRNTAGCGLKKSPRREAHHRLRRRKWIERTTASSADLGPARADPGAALSLQLEGAVGRRRSHLVELLLPPLSHQHARASGGGLPRATCCVTCRASCWWSGTGCPRIGRDWSVNSSARSAVGSRSSGCRATPRNSIRWNISGVTGSITSCPTSVRAISPSSAITPAAPWRACAAGPPL